MPVWGDLKTRYRVANFDALVIILGRIYPKVDTSAFVNSVGLVVSCSVNPLHLDSVQAVDSEPIQAQFGILDTTTIAANAVVATIELFYANRFNQLPLLTTIVKILVGLDVDIGHWSARRSW